MSWLLVLASVLLSTLFLYSKTILSLEPYPWEGIYQVCIPFLLPHYGLDHYWGPCLSLVGPLFIYLFIYNLCQILSCGHLFPDCQNTPQRGSATET